jgi:peptidoglycan/xylan/chitin deacetylase (PgdA/CDA1 family)
MFVLTQHPHVGGRRSRIVQLDRLITYIKSKREVWFATMEQVANYVKPTGS